MPSVFTWSEFCWCTGVCANRLFSNEIIEYFLHNTSIYKTYGSTIKRWRRLALNCCLINFVFIEMVRSQKVFSNFQIRWSHIWTISMVVRKCINLFVESSWIRIKVWCRYKEGSLNIWSLRNTNFYMSRYIFRQLFPCSRVRFVPYYCSDDALYKSGRNVTPIPKTYAI